MKTRELLELLAAIREAQSTAPPDTAPMWSWQMAKAAHAMEPHASVFREAIATGSDIQKIQEIEAARHAIIRRIAERNPDGTPRITAGVYDMPDGAGAIVEAELTAKFSDAITVLTEHNAKAETLMDQDIEFSPPKIGLKLWPKLAPSLFDRLFAMISE